MSVICGLYLHFTNHEGEDLGNEDEQHWPTSESNFICK